MTYHPSLWRSVAVSSFLIIGGGVAVLSANAHLALRAVGLVAIGMAILMPTGVYKSWVRIEDDQVVVGGRLGVREFRRNDSSVRRTWAPGKLIGRKDALVLTRTDGVESLLVLGVYRKSDRPKIARAAAEALNAH